MRGLICLNARETAAVNFKQTFTNIQGEKDIKKRILVRRESQRETHLLIKLKVGFSCSLQGREKLKFSIYQALENI